MDFTFTEEQQAAAEAAAAVFADTAPDVVPSPALVSGAVADDFDRALWSRLAAADLLGLVLAEEHGGAGLGATALCLVLREAGRVLARVPLLEHCATAAALQAHAGPELAAALLPGAGAGRPVLTAAAHGRTGHDPAELAVTARRDGADWLLDGMQTAVPWAHGADWTAVPAHTGGGEAVLALVPRGAPGLALADQFSTSGERLAELTLNGVRVPAAHLIQAPQAWERLRGLLTLGTCALALGAGSAVLGMTSRYTAQREQFGFPVATFQAVAVQAADRYVDLRAMEAVLWQAAWRLDADGAGGPLPAAGDLAVAKIWASEGVRRIVQTAQHLHGGLGADTGYPLHRYHAWAKQLELQLGPAAAHEQELGDLLAAHPLS
ncbi:acyl-CoA dehydrogenase family protein [Streptomyces sp. 2P-4]|uniref:acyl-CoA dehydrogenase family protein n=1 Tax=Streptomyces sp. 2P-4 TaxID=2931974 RepID=UPI0025414408|nr:acyl-CoA dehydrogenase family protein [Streptomyces sp. 2P-4]